MISPIKTHRNAQCPCGSGKKYKACCAGIASANPADSKIDIEAVHCLANNAIARADFLEAEHCFRKLAEAKPKDAYFQASLGQALCWLRRKKEGVSHLMQAAKLLERQANKSRDPKFLVDLSAQLMHWGEVGMGEKLARLAVAMAPNSPSVLNNLVLCLTRVNRNADALPLSQKVCRLIPEHPGCNIVLAMLEAQLVNTEQALTRLNSVIEHNLDPEQTARAWLEKAVILDKSAAYDDAYFAMIKAGEMHAALSPYTPAQRELIFDTLERNRAGFDRNLLNQWPVQNLTDDELPVPVFLLGFLRSGTTLTEQVLGTHPQIIATDESSIIHEVTVELEKMSQISGDHAKALSALKVSQIKQLRQFYWRRMREEYGEEVMSRQLVDKNALNTIELGVISVIFPEAKIIFALRDPRDVCLSCFMQSFSPSPATANMTSLPNIARQYSEVMGYWLALRDRMQPKFLELRYEDTVSNFEVTFRQVFAFIGVDWHESVSKFHERAKGRYISTPSFAAVSKPVYNSAIKRWLNYEPHFEAIQPQLQPFIDVFGYNEKHL